MRHSLFLLAPLGLAATAAAQAPAELRPRWRPAKSLEAALPPASDLRTIVVKIQDDALARAESGGMRSTSGGLDVSAVAAEIESVPGSVVLRLVELPDADLDRMRREGERAIGEELADLSQLFVVRLPEGADGAALVAAILARPEVEFAYAAVQPFPAGDIVPPVTCDFSPQQGYRAAAPAGIDAAFAQSLPGGTGTGVTVADIEFSWRLTHEDLQTNGPGALLGPPGFDPFMNDNHGTAVVGVLSADPDAGTVPPPGIRGLVPSAALRVIAGQTNTTFANVPAAIVRGTLNLNCGDVLLLELQFPGPNSCPNCGSPPLPPCPPSCPNLTNSQFGSVPVEFYLAEYWAIRQATALGIHVVEAAGNGSQDFDSLNSAPGVGVATGHPSYAVLQPGSPAYRESGAILVGAASSTVPHVRLGFSNFGTRVDAYSWGQNVVTLAYGDLFDGSVSTTCPIPAPLPAPDPNQRYTALFNGTSSASPIVTGAAASLEAAHLATHGTVLRPEALRLLLRTTGTASGNPASDRIGTQPDLADQMTIVPMGPQVAHVFTPALAGSGFGRSVAGVGDVNGDGVPDLAVGGPLTTPMVGQIMAGAATVYDGRTGAAIYAWSNAGQFEQFGRSVAGAGDVNGDGLSDVIVGVPGVAGAFFGNRVEVRSGSTGAVLLTFTGASGETFGETVAGPGDLDGDGTPDVLVGAPLANGGQGRALTYSGATGSLLQTWTSPSGGGTFGTSVAGAGDVNGDGTRDVLVGQPQGSVPGQAFVFSGITTTVLHTFTGAHANDQFGAAVAGAGDVNADGSPDLLVGAWQDNTAATGAGRAVVFSGASGAVLFTFSGANANDALGYSVANGGDRDADGRSDLLVGGVGGNGFVEVRSGGTGALLANFVGQASGDAFGTSVASAGDLDGDGRPDAIVGGANNGFAGSMSGRAYVFLAPPRCSTPALAGLVANPPTISALAANAASLAIRAGVANAAKTYLVLAGVSGSIPGTPLPGGQILPVNLDFFTFIALGSPLACPFGAFLGVLDGGGNATATFGGGCVPPTALASVIGLSFTFAAITLDFVFVSNPTTVTVIP
jgi:hypothetical protein